MNLWSGICINGVPYTCQYAFIIANVQVNVGFLENGGGGHWLLHAGYKFSVRNVICDMTSVIRSES
jgi:hypothetical protein